MAGVVDDEGSAPIGLHYRWWPVMIAVLVAGSVLLLLPVFKFPLAFTLVAVGLCVAVALVVWGRPGLRHRRMSKACRAAGDRQAVAGMPGEDAVAEVRSDAIAVVPADVDSKILERVLARYKVESGTR